MQLAMQSTKCRKICYISGTRADYGLMRSTLKAIDSSTELSLSVLATGMHLSKKYGLTVQEIEADGLVICGRVETPVEISTGAAMARGIGIMLIQFVDILERERPDVVVLLGDRGEMLAGALAAIHLNIPLVHVHGGERSGTVDEPIRHAISKLSHWHCVATEESRKRLISMGEDPRRIFVTGAPGLDGIFELSTIDRVSLCVGVNFDPAKQVALLVFHPILQEAHLAGQQMTDILEALLFEGMQVMALHPNSDSGGDEISAALVRYARGYADMRLVTHMPRHEFVSWMAVADIMIGNSSSGIIEAASFGTPVINVGLRQNMRERNANVFDVGTDKNALRHAVAAARKMKRFEPINVYGDGNAGARIVDLLVSLEITPELLLKTNAY